VLLNFTSIPSLWAQSPDAPVSPLSQEMTSVEVREKKGEVSIENKLIRVSYDLVKGTYSAFDKIKNSLIMNDGSSRFSILEEGKAIPSEFSSNGSVNTYTIEPVADALGMGQSILVFSEPEKGPKMLVRISVYKEFGFIALAGGVENTTSGVIQLKEFKVLDNATFFRGAGVRTNFSLLNGSGGGIGTSVSHGEGNRPSINNIMATFGSQGNNRTLVMGGLSYSEFEKYAGIDIVNDFLQGQVYAKDPIGKRIDPGTSYQAKEDRFYIDFMTDNPFDALEAYANYIRIAQGVVLPVCRFPIIDTWFSQVPHFGGGSRDTTQYRGRNDSFGAVEEMNCVVRSGFLKYAPVAVLLEPDLYGSINQQGWWDDEHWQRGPGNRAKKAPNWVSSNGQFVSPFETARKWAGAVKEMGGIPMIYLQTGFRSNDYAEKFPGHMIANETYKPHLNVKGEQQYRDPKTKKEPRYLGYDYTDPGFVSHVRDVWENLRLAGIQGCKFDYPDYPFTGWPESGGLENPYATTAMHYRNVFKLAKDGLGTDYYIHERALSRGSDVTIGLATSQRTEGDTDEIDKNMVTRNGLRWYKNRVVMNYDMDGKNPFHAIPDNRDGVRSMFTMSYVVTGTLMMVPSFGRMTPEQIYDLSRIYPFHSNRQSARPVDAFTREFPQVYDFRVNTKWHQVTFYNSETEERMSPIFFQGEINEPRSITGKLKSGASEENSVAKYVWNKFSDEQKERAELYSTDPKPLVDVLNNLIKGESLDLQECFKAIKLSGETAKLKHKSNRTKEENILFNKMLLIDALQIRARKAPCEATIGVNLAGNTAFGALGLDANRQYYVYDFWNNNFVGKIDGNKRLEQTLRPGEARMMSVHEVESNPQVISTDRHLMQGYADLLGVKWDPQTKILNGVCNVVGGEPYRAIIATNGSLPSEVSIDESVEKSVLKSNYGPGNPVITRCNMRIIPGNNGLVELTLERSNNGPVVWNLSFK
jgi:hypothetical protein